MVPQHCKQAPSSIPLLSRLNGINSRKIAGEVLPTRYDKRCFVQSSADSSLTPLWLHLPLRLCVFPPLHRVSHCPDAAGSCGHGTGRPRPGSCASRNKQGCSGITWSTWTPPGAHASVPRVLPERKTKSMSKLKRLPSTRRKHHNVRPGRVAESSFSRR